MLSLSAIKGIAMKSPVYGLGRNWKHRATRNAHFAPSAANINLKGKKDRRMGCGCCYCLDKRDQEAFKTHLQEIREAFNE